jgi:hypothetical protein
MVNEHLFSWISYHLVKSQLTIVERFCIILWVLEISTTRTKWDNQCSFLQLYFDFTRNHITISLHVSMSSGPEDISHPCGWISFRPHYIDLDVLYDPIHSSQDEICHSYIRGWICDASEMFLEIPELLYLQFTTGFAFTLAPSYHSYLTAWVSHSLTFTVP